MATEQHKQQQQAVMLRFATDLKSKSEGIRNKAAKDLYTYVSTELREVSQEELNTFLDDFNHHIFEMVSGDTNSKMGGILAIVALMNADVCNTGTRISRYKCLKLKLDVSRILCILVGFLNPIVLMQVWKLPPKQLFGSG